MTLVTHRRNCDDIHIYQFLFYFFERRERNVEQEAGSSVGLTSRRRPPPVPPRSARRRRRAAGVGDFRSAGRRAAPFDRPSAEPELSRWRSRPEAEDRASSSPGGETSEPLQNRLGASGWPANQQAPHSHVVRCRPMEGLFTVVPIFFVLRFIDFCK